MKKIGILGGISAASTVQYYNKILDLYYEIKKDYYYPEICIESLNFQYFTDFENRNDMDGYKEYIMKGIRNLESAGSDIIIMSANSPHSVFHAIEKEASVPMLSIVDSVGKYARKNKMKKLLLTVIKYTMQGSFYRDELKSQGIEVISPSDGDQDIINHIIFDELARNNIKASSQERFLSIVEKYSARYSLDGVILGCTELPMLAGTITGPVPFIDSLAIHCADTLHYVLEI